MSKKKEEYPRINQLGLTIHESDNSYPGVNNAELNAALKKHGLDPDLFSEFFGVQTCGANGLYPWDVESVLTRMMTGRLTGTQLLWD